MLSSAAELSQALKQGLAAGEPKGQLLRAVRQFIGNTERSKDVAAMLREPPVATGERRWDALLAGVVEYIALRCGVPVPAWTVEEERFLDEWWFVTDVERLYPTAFVETPRAIANRGVFIRRASLVNV